MSALTALGSPSQGQAQPITCFLATSGDGFPSGLLDALQGMFGITPLFAAAAGSEGSAPPGAGGAAAGAATGQQGQPQGQEPRREPLPRGEAERRALAYLEDHRGEGFTPGQIAREIDARGCRDLMARLHARGIVEMITEHPLTYAMPKAKGRRRRA